MTRDVVKPASLMRATGQMWKLNVGTGAFVIGAILLGFGLLPKVNFEFLFAALATQLLGIAFCSVAIRCPKCGAKWYWYALRREQPTYARWLCAQTECRSCGYTVERNDA
jgi:hypothetical protein